MDAPATIDRTNEMIRQHGLATVFAVVLLGVLAYLAYMQSGQLEYQIKVYQENSKEELTSIREDLQLEREYVRGKLTETLDGNSEALRTHTDAIRELTNEFKRQRQ